MHSIVTFVAKYFIVLALVIAFIAWWRLNNQRKKDYIVLAIVAGVLSLIIAKIGSKLYYDPRPFVVGHFTPYLSHGNDNGFPSDHTLLSSFLAFVTIYFSRRLGWLLLLVSILIGSARVIAGVHHLYDIVGSIVFSGLAVFIAQWALFGRRRGDPEAANRPASRA